jgi:hypothetical protein
LHALQALVQTAARVLHDMLRSLLPLRGPGSARTPARVESRVAIPDVPGSGQTRRAGAGQTAAAPQDRALAPDTEPAHTYGQGRVVLVARDPWSLFAYWEIPPMRRVEVLRSLAADGEAAQEILRVFETARIPPPFRDIEFAPGAGWANVAVEHAGRTYRVEVGLRTVSGRFVPLATSNLVSTPAAEPSDDTSVRWVALDADGSTREVAVAWHGRRVATPRHATALDGPARMGAGRPGSSEALPPGPRASDALPIR